MLSLRLSALITAILLMVCYVITLIKKIVLHIAVFQVEALGGGKALDTVLHYNYHRGVFSTTKSSEYGNINIDKTPAENIEQY